MSSGVIMLIVRGPAKVDLIFPDVPHDHEPPWVVDSSTLSGIDEHFWDWVLWLTSKVDAGKESLVEAELITMHEHLLAPLGIPAPSVSLRDAVERYIAARDSWARRFGVVVDRRVEQEVLPIVELCGSRASGTAGRYSDWDFRVATHDFAVFASELPGLVQGLDPLVEQWDRLSDEACFMTAASTGIARVYVNGIETVVDGEATGARPGAVLRSGRDTTTVTVH